MIWCLIGYILMGVVGSDFLAGIIIGIRLKMSGHRDDYYQLANCIIELHEKRRDKCALRRLSNRNSIMALIYIVFKVITWPVDFLRIIFFDYHDAI